jgi:hypothetical protein
MVIDLWSVYSPGKTLAWRFNHVNQTKWLNWYEHNSNLKYWTIKSVFDSEDNAESEITAYMRERADPDTDSLAWWKDNSDKYSRLLVLARRYLAVPSERIFSAAGLIVTKLRNRSSSCIDQIIFLNKNSVPQWPKDNHECDMT